jgi:hypothetical protein
MSLRFRSCFTAVLLAAIVSAKAGMASDVPTLDPHFGGADGIARVGFDVVANGSDMAEAALLADGKLLLAGTAQTGTGQYDLAFARLDAVSGAPDPASAAARAACWRGSRQSRRSRESTSRAMPMAASCSWRARSTRRPRSSDA